MSVCLHSCSKCCENVSVQTDGQRKNETNSRVATFSSRSFRKKEIPSIQTRRAVPAEHAPRSQVSAVLPASARVRNYVAIQRAPHNVPSVLSARQIGNFDHSEFLARSGCPTSVQGTAGQGQVGTGIVQTVYCGQSVSKREVCCPDLAELRSHGGRSQPSVLLACCHPDLAGGAAAGQSAEVHAENAFRCCFHSKYSARVDSDGEEEASAASHSTILVFIEIDIVVY